ncbi:MAG: DUF1573 domain-containing protein [Planctomycetota bacterium]|jgi:hypothetical protein
MKRNWFATAVVGVTCGLVLPGGCQEQAQQVSPAEKPPARWAEPPPAPEQVPPPPEVKAGPKIVFEEVVYDFGEVGPGTKGVAEYEFKNAGELPLHIGRIQTCCGVVAELKGNKRDYAPGQSGTVVVTYRPRGLPGVVKKRIYVASNDKKEPKVELTVVATIALKVRSNPDKLNLVLNRENAGCPDITLTSVDGMPFTIKSFNATAGSITTEFDAAREANEFVLKPKADIAKLRGSLHGYVRIGVTHPQCNVVTIPISVLPRFSVNPNSLLFRNVKPEERQVRELSVINNYGEDFEVESASSRNGLVKVLSREKLDRSCKFRLEVTPPDAQGRGFFTDVFTVKIRGGEELRINCRGFYPRKQRR